MICYCLARREIKRRLLINYHRNDWTHARGIGYQQIPRSGRAQQGERGSYCEGALCGVTVNETDTTRLPMPACLAVTRTVPVYVPAAIPATLAETNTEEGASPAEGITWSHDAPPVANHDTALGPEAIMVIACPGGFAPPSIATKLSAPGATVSDEAAVVEEAASHSAIVSVRHNVNRDKSHQGNLRISPPIYCIGTSSHDIVYVGTANRSRNFALGAYRK